MSSRIKNDTSKANVGAEMDVTPHQLIEALTLFVPSNVPVMVWGPPGVGKSQIMEQVASLLDMEYRDYFAILMDTVDLHGMPWRDSDKNRTRWAPPGEFPESNGKRYLLNLDEITSATPSVQAALYQFVLKGRIGEYQLPAGSTIVACGNRESDRGVAYTMPTPLVSRFRHFTLKVDSQEWLDWAARNAIDPDVLFFIGFRPELLFEFDPTEKNTPFPCPRTWEFMSNDVAMFTDDEGNPRASRSVELASYSGTVGPGPAAEFMAFRRLKKNLPHPTAVLNDPANAVVPDKSDVLLALCGALCRKANPQNFEQVIAYAERIRPEVGEFLVGSCLKRDDQLKYTRAFTRWAASANR